MKLIGIVRDIDKLGRIVLPKEMRDTLNMNAGDAVEIFATENGFFIRKYDKNGKGLECQTK